MRTLGFGARLIRLLGKGHLGSAGCGLAVRHLMGMGCFGTTENTFWHIDSPGRLIMVKLGYVYYINVIINLVYVAYSLEQAKRIHKMPVPREDFPHSIGFRVLVGILTIVRILI